MKNETKKLTLDDLRKIKGGTDAEGCEYGSSEQGEDENDKGKVPGYKYAGGKEELGVSVKIGDVGGPTP